jgi:chorismate--pyruvate lyase
MFEELSQKQIDWITDKNSLTQRLRTFTNNQISLHLFYDDWGITDENTEAWIRRTEWRYFDETWISATVIIPEQSITEETIELTRIGNRPIGEILFQDSTLTRTDFVFNPLEKKIWSRHSVFHYKGKPVSVIENFYPAFLDTIA